MNKYIKYGLIPLAIIGAGLGIAYLLTRKVKKSWTPVPGSIDNNSNNTTLSNVPLTPGQQTSLNSKYEDCTFPIQLGSNGRCVKLIQEALIHRFGNDCLPKHGADGDWGNETEQAMSVYTLSNSIDDPATLDAFLNFYNL